MQILTNNSRSTLLNAIDAIDTVLTVQAGEGNHFAALGGDDFQVMTLKSETAFEIIKVTSRTGDVFTVERAQEGTFSLSFDAGSEVYAGLTVGGIEGLKVRNLDNQSPFLGYRSLDIQSQHGGRDGAFGRFAYVFGVDNQANDHSLAMGYQSLSYKYAVSMGYKAEAYTSGVGIGRESKATGSSAVSMGYASLASGQHSMAIGSSPKASGFISMAMGFGVIASGSSSIAIGDGSIASGSSSVAIGKHSQSLIGSSFAIGYNAISRIGFTHVLSGLSISRKDNAETNEIKDFSSQENVIFSKIIDLTQPSLDNVVVLSIPLGSTFYVSECGLIITESDTVSVNPEISFGIESDSISLVAQNMITISTLKSRQKFTSLLDESGQSTLTASLKVSASATALKARFYFKGILVED